MSINPLSHVPSHRPGACRTRTIVRPITIATRAPISFPTVPRNFTTILSGNHVITRATCPVSTPSFGKARLTSRSGKNKCTAKNEGARFVDMNSCCHFFECISGKLIPQTCSHPKLFDIHTRTCAPYRQVKCDGRRQCLSKCKCCHLTTAPIDHRRFSSQVITCPITRRAKVYVISFHRVPATAMDSISIAASPTVNRTSNVSTIV